MMNNEIESPRELKFICPECGSNELIAAVGGWLEFEHVYDTGLLPGATSESNSSRTFTALGVAMS